MFWENKDIVVGASSHLIHGFHTLADTLKKKWDWELSFFFLDFGLNNLHHIPVNTYCFTLRILKSSVQRRLWVSERLLEGTRTIKILLFFSI